MRCVILVLLLLSAAPLLAQQNPQEAKPPDTVTDYSDPLHPKTTVIVTATRSEEQVQKSANSVTVVTPEDIEVRSKTDVDQTLTLTPGLYIQRMNGASDSNAQSLMRGYSGPQRTMVLLDGQPLNDSLSGGVNWSSLPTDEIQSVEIVRGPFSSLYGSDAVGGVINIMTRPIDRREFEIRGEYGGYATERHTIHYSERFFNRLGISLGYQRVQTGGYPMRAETVSATAGSTGQPVTGVVPTETTMGSPTYIVGWNGSNWFNQHSYRAKAEYSLSGSTTVSVQYMWMGYGYGYDQYHSNLVNPAGAAVDNGQFLFTANGVTRQLTVTPKTFLNSGPGGSHNYLIGATILHKFSGNQFIRLDAGYYNTPTYNYRTPGAAATSSGGAGTVADGTRRNLHANLQFNRDAGRNHLVAGSETRHDVASQSNFNSADWTSPVSRTSQYYFAYGETVDQSGYVQDQITVSDRLSLVAGGRFDYWRTYNGVSNNYTPASPLTPYPDRSQNSLTGKLALTYSMPGDLVFRVSAGTAFHSPAIYDLYATSVLSGITYASNPTLKPERVKSWEVGVRKSFGRRANFDVDYFENYISNMIYRMTDFAADPTGDYRVDENAGAGRTRGVEIANQVNLLSWLQFRGTLTYNNPIVTSNPANPADVGKRVLYVPAFMTTGQLIGAKGKWTGSVSERYVGRAYGVDTNVDTTRGVPGGYDLFSVMDANLGYDVNKHLQVYGRIENLLDRQYYTFYLAPGRTATGGIRIRL